MIAQFESFEIHKDVIENLLPNEEIIYQVKTIYLTKGEVILNWVKFLIPIYSPLIILFLLKYFDIEMYNFDLIIFVSLIPFYIIYLNYILRNNMGKPLGNFIYISNKKLYFFNIGWRRDSIAEMLELRDIKAISYVKFNTKNDYEDLGKIYFYPSLIYSKIADISRIKQIIDTIMFYYCDRMKRIEDFERKNDMITLYKFEFKGIELCLYDDRLTVSGKEIRYSEDFSFYYKYSFYNNFLKYLVFDATNFNFRVKLPFNHLKIFELIYLKTINWKEENGRLLKIGDLDKLKKDSKTIEIISSIKSIDMDIHPITKSDKKIEKIIDSLNNNEEVFINHYHKIEIKDKAKAIAQMILILLAIYLFIYFIIPSMLFFSIYLLYLLIPFIILLSLVSAFSSKKKVFFTNQRLLVWYKKQISQTSYDNIASISCTTDDNFQNITIKLKQPFDGNYKPYNLELLLGSPSHLNLFQKIKYILNKYSTYFEREDTEDSVIAGKDKIKSIEPAIEKIDFKPLNKSNIIFKSFLDNLEENEQILLEYHPESEFKQNLEVTGIIMATAIAILPFSIVISGSDFLISYGIILLIMGPLGVGIILFPYIFSKFKIICTNNRILIRKRKRIGYTKYSNIKSIICDEVSDYQYITLNLKEPWKGSLLNKEIKTKVKAPLHLRLFEKLKYLNDQKQ